MAATRRRLTRNRLIAVSVAAVVLAGAGSGAVFAATRDTAEYRTAVAQLGSVSETLSVSGTIASATRRDLAFGAAGTVDAVAVEVGDTVAAGDTLATVGTDDLQDAVDQAADKVAQAEQALASDLDSQTTTSVASTPTASTPTVSAPSVEPLETTPTSTPTTPTPAQTAALAQVTAAQQSLLALVDAASASLAASEDATATSATICAPFLSAALTAEESTDPSVEPVETTPSDSTATDLASVQQLLVACQEAITGVGSAQAVTAAAQASVMSAMTTLDDAIAALESAYASVEPVETPSSTPAQSTTRAAATTAIPSAGATQAGEATAASAADIVADRAAIAAAEAEVLIAQQQLSGATLTTPIAGTVAQVALSVGDEVAADSATAVITVIGDDGYVIESTVSLAQIAKVQVGQTADVTILSTGATYEAGISSVGIANVSTTSTPAYAVTVAVDPAGATILNGAAATADIAVSSGEDVLTVPISTLHSDATGDTVDVLSDGVVTSTPVEVGAIGSEAVEITTGLAAGDVVVIADLGEEIAADETSTDMGLAGLGGDTSTQTGPAGFTPPEGFTPPTG